MTRTKTCAGCGRGFRLKPFQRAATDRCPECVRKSRTRICPGCGVTFVLSSYRKKGTYCSLDCYQNAAKERPLS